jgi:hypothetical protein
MLNDWGFSYAINYNYEREIGENMMILNNAYQPTGILTGTKISVCLNSSPASQNEINLTKPCENNQYRFASKSIEHIKLSDKVLTLNQECMISSIQSEQYHGYGVKIIHPELPEEITLLPFQRILIPRGVKYLSHDGEWTNIPKGHFQRARELRKQSTPPEQKLWGYLCSSQLGIKFRSQHPIGPYIVDFYARQAGLVIEIDGDSAHGSQ